MESKTSVCVLVKNLFSRLRSLSSEIIFPFSLSTHSVGKSFLAVCGRVALFLIFLGDILRWVPGGTPEGLTSFKKGISSGIGCLSEVCGLERRARLR